MACRKTVNDFILTCIGGVIIKKEKTGVIGDIHIGYESTLAPPGSLPFSYTEHVEEDIKELVDMGIEMLIINGDIQHEFSPYEQYTMNELKTLLHILQEIKNNEKVEIQLIKGNHDTYIHKIIEKKKFDLPLKKSIAIGDFYIFHGHEYPEGLTLKKIKEESKGTVTSHEHPVINIRDEVGGGIRLDTFLIKEKHIILPSFLPFSHGTDIITSENKDLMNVILRDEGKEDFNIYAIDHYNDRILYFGKVKELESVMRV